MQTDTDHLHQIFLEVCISRIQLVLENYCLWKCLDFENGTLGFFSLFIHIISTVISEWMEKEWKIFCFFLVRATVTSSGNFLLQYWVLVPREPFLMLVTFMQLEWITWVNTALVLEGIKFLELPVRVHLKQSRSNRMQKLVACLFTSKRSDPAFHL